MDSRAHKVIGVVIGRTPITDRNRSVITEEEKGVSRIWQRTTSVTVSRANVPAAYFRRADRTSKNCLSAMVVMVSAA